MHDAQGLGKAAALPSRTVTRWVALGWLCIAWALTAPTALGQPASAADAAPDGSSSAGSAPVEIPLPPLPELEPISHPPPSPAASRSLEGRLTQLAATRIDDPAGGEAALAFLTADLEADIVPAVAQSIQDLRARIDGRAAERLLEKARKKGRRALRKAKVDDDGDWLAFTLALGARETSAWQSLVQLYGMLRLLEAVGDTPAVREMIGCYSHFGELVRIDLQRAVTRLGDKAVPALIEARKHEARKVRRWASRQLDRLGRAIPGEAVSTTDPVLLADVLRAFGRTRDVDATRVVLSFCGSDRPELRRAAREAVGAIGEPGAWQLREAYLTLAGKKAPRSWSFERAARELFRLHDRARLAVVYRRMDEGKAALQGGRHREAAAAFDEVLAHVPRFDRRAEMAPAYLGYADELSQAGKRDEALVALRKALLLSPAEADASKIESRLAFLEGQALVEQGTPDRLLLRRAVELDPSNEAARELLSSLQTASKKRQDRSKRYLAAVVVGVLGLLAMVVLARRRPRPASAQSR